jgi:hypothetical protein
MRQSPNIRPVDERRSDGIFVSKILLLYAIYLRNRLLIVRIFVAKNRIHRRRIIARSNQASSTSFIIDKKLSNSFSSCKQLKGTCHDVEGSLQICLQKGRIGIHESESKFNCEVPFITNGKSEFSTRSIVTRRLLSSTHCIHLVFLMIGMVTGVE